MKKIISGLVSAAALVIATQASAASLLGQAPAASKIYTASNGLEWVYAGPCAGLSPSCGTVQLHSGFNFATAQQWTDSFSNLNGLISAFNLNSFNQAQCAAAEFNVAHNHCDAGDAVSGYVWNSPLAASASHASNGAAETFLVRASNVTEPGSVLLLGLGLFGLAFARKKAAK